MSPMALRSEPNALASYYETRGPASSQGVTRNVDRYGLTPPIFVIEGTTGWDYHSADGYAYTGLESIQLLEQFLKNYETLNQGQLDAGSPDLYTLEFYDYFKNQFWVIEPTGPQTFRQDVSKPQLSFYRFRWVAITPIGGVSSDENDDISNTLSTPPNQAISNTSSNLMGVTGAYTPTGAPTGMDASGGSLV
jgi:hypothetical protein